MKTALFGLFMLFTSISPVAAETNVPDPETRLVLKQEVSKLLKFHTLDIPEEVVVMVALKFTPCNRMQVVKIYSDDPHVQEFITRSLNDKKMKNLTTNDHQIYHFLSVRLKRPV